MTKDIIEKSDEENIWEGLAHCIKAIAEHEERITKLEGGNVEKNQ